MCSSVFEKITQGFAMQMYGREYESLFAAMLNNSDPARTTQ